MSTKWFIQLGEAEGARFTHVPQAPGGLRVLGSIRRDAQIGALAVDEQGRYVQVNGDHVTALSQSQVAAAVRRASKQQASARTGGMRPGRARRPASAAPARAAAAPDAGSSAWPPQAAPAAPAKPPVVVIRRRKTLEIL
jgi:hypothetical protein